VRKNTGPNFFLKIFSITLDKIKKLRIFVLLSKFKNMKTQENRIDNKDVKGLALTLPSKEEAKQLAKDIKAITGLAVTVGVTRKGTCRAVRVLFASCKFENQIIQEHRGEDRYKVAVALQQLGYVYKGGYDHYAPTAPYVVSGHGQWSSPAFVKVGNMEAYNPPVAAYMPRKEFMDAWVAEREAENAKKVLPVGFVTRLVVV
jgi:hypothetical protein